MQVRSLGQKILLEEAVAIHSRILPGESLGQKSLEGYSPWGHRVTESHATERLTHTHTECRKIVLMNLFAGQE